MRPFDEKRKDRFAIDIFSIAVVVVLGFWLTIDNNDPSWVLLAIASGFAYACVRVAFGR